MEELLESQRNARNDLVDTLRRELLGPFDGADETLHERPTLRYLVGRLAPAGTTVAAEEDDAAAEAAADDDDADAGGAVPLTLAMNPSSIGLSVIVAAGTDRVTAIASWADYLPDKEVTVDEAGKEHSRNVYRRQPVEQPVDLDLTEHGKLRTKHLPTSVDVEWLSRPLPDGRIALSVFLVNRREASDKQRPEEDEWLFQPKLLVRASDGSPVFDARRLEDTGLPEELEMRSLELLYWNRPEYGVGHGCAVEWDAPPHVRGQASAVWTEIVPAYELPRIAPREDVGGERNMRELGGSGPDGVPAERLREMLEPLAAEYGAWVDDLETNHLPAVEPSLQPVARGHIEGCRIALERVREGIELVCSNQQVREAFCFANRAMALQRERSVIALNRRRGFDPPEHVATKWRPFQLAFILLNLPSMVDRRHPDRQVADLLWFPTGGGKTEAYLGLTAFALAHRRLRPALDNYRNDAGLTVLMRYTLRLLTIQQFQRATTLILACEHLRVTEGVWGERQFSIGLWVGRAATPNQYSSPSDETGAKEALQRIRNGHRTKEGSPMQLLSCPWCGAKLTIDDYRADDETERVFITCSDDECEFSPTRMSTPGMPVHVVDQEVYRHVPSLVIATVDKFARMPWNGRTQALFGRIGRECERHGFISWGEQHPNSHPAKPGVPKASVAETTLLEPPDLVIQDELHLISGPLGTMVGTYEVAVDLLSTVTVDGEKSPPKVIASTATIRRAERQVGALFDRRLQIFPPSGLDAGNSWFGSEVPLDEAPGRLYLGICAPGKSVKTALVRVYASVLARAQSYLEGDARVGDAYMTLVGYFNSLRELGGALRLVEDDVPGRMRVLSRRDRKFWPYRDLYEREELTSNKKAEQVPEILGKLERRFTGEKPKVGEYPVDTVLCSNMISVGVDIDRLGLMIVMGQPKTTAEYIQATSRVGRQTPGLVVTVYNWTRPRDLSHYEQFRSYHSMLYRYVEATSVTPFSARARDKALDGVMTALVRLGDSAMTPEQAARDFDPASAWLAQLIEAIARRAEAVANPYGDNSVYNATVSELKGRRDTWQRLAGDEKELCYTRFGLDKRPGHEQDRRYLLGEAENRHDAEFEAPGSLREVEGEVHVYLPPEVVKL